MRYMCCPLGLYSFRQKECLVVRPPSFPSLPNSHVRAFAAVHFMYVWWWCVCVHPHPWCAGGYCCCHCCVWVWGQVLVKCKADLTAENGDGLTPTSIAQRLQNVAVLKAMIPTAYSVIGSDSELRTHHVGGDSSPHREMSHTSFGSSGSTYTAILDTSGIQQKPMARHHSAPAVIQPVDDADGAAAGGGRGAEFRDPSASDGGRSRRASGVGGGGGGGGGTGVSERVSELVSE